MSEQPVTVAEPAESVPEPERQPCAAEDEAVVVDELIVEEVSIDGMCGVY
jgi:mycofactocin precursor